jgi:nucleotide-binding universal stress UspA family protein
MTKEAESRIEGREIFGRVLCGIDGTPESLEALRQADSLRDPSGRLTVVTALELASTAEAGWAATGAAAQLEAAAALALEAARAEVPGADLRCVEGRADQVLSAEAERLDATLVAVGTHGIRRLVGVAIGSVTTMVLREAPCSVLVARARAEGEEQLGAIVVGVDGSPQSELAAAVAFQLGERFGVEVRPVTVGGDGVDRNAVEAIVPDAVVTEGRPVEALIASAGRSDLLVIGSRGLAGLRSLGSVSERVAHRAPCSVLVVRPPARA